MQGRLQAGDLLKIRGLVLPALEYISSSRMRIHVPTHTGPAILAVLRGFKVSSGTVNDVEAILQLTFITLE